MKKMIKNRHTGELRKAKKPLAIERPMTLAEAELIAMSLLWDKSEGGNERMDDLLSEKIRAVQAERAAKR